MFIELVIKKNGVIFTLLRVNYIPQKYVDDYCNEKFGDMPKLNLYDFITLALGFSKSKKGSKVAKILKPIKKITSVIEIMQVVATVVEYVDYKDFQKEMEKGKGIAILEIRISASGLDSTTINSYRSWDGRSDLNALLQNK